MVDEPDIVNERLWEMYLLDCRANDMTPSIKDYLIWVDENY